MYIYIYIYIYIYRWDMEYLNDDQPIYQQDFGVPCFETNPYFPLKDSANERNACGKSQQGNHGTIFETTEKHMILPWLLAKKPGKQEGEVCKQ